MSGAGNVVVSVPAGAATDAAGNLSLASTSTDKTVAFDKVAPSVTDQPSGGTSGSDEQHEPDGRHRGLQRDGYGLYCKRHQLCEQHGGRHALGGGDRDRRDLQRGAVVSTVLKATRIVRARRRKARVARRIRRRPGRDAHHHVAGPVIPDTATL